MDSIVRREPEPPSLPRHQTGAQAVAQVIAAQGKPMVYGIPGGYTMHINDALYAHKDKVRTFLLRQESVATDCGAYLSRRHVIA